MKNKNNEKAMRALKLVLSIATNVVFNTCAMEQQTPIYEILAKQKMQYREKELRKPFSAKYYSDLLKEYKEYEGDIKAIKPMSDASIWGGINYAMTLEEMKQKIKEKFEQMKKSNLIISKDKFESIKDKYFLTPRANLTRIWGAEYLKQKISASPILNNNYDVPKYIIVLDNPNEISVDISFRDSMFPVVTQLNNGQIYFEKIVGTGVAVKGSSMQWDIGGETSIGYVDFGDPGNIIRQANTQKNYIVDTEFNSFDFKIKMNTLLQEMLNYASARFRYLNSEKDRCTYTFNL